MALPRFYPLTQEIVDRDTGSEPVIKPATTNKGMSGGVNFKHHFVPDNLGGTVIVSNHAGAEDNRIYNTIDNIMPKMALLYNSNGAVITPKYGSAIDEINKPFNFAGIALTPTNFAPAVWLLKEIENFSPPVRYFTSMVYVNHIQKVLLFAGNVSSGGTKTNDTWLYNPKNSSWEEQLPDVSPPARSNYGIVYNNDTEEVIIFGGIDVDGYRMNDTWRYSFTLGTWQELFPATSPTNRGGHRMVYDSERDVIVLFGGGLGAQQNQTWEYDGSTWTLIVTTNSPPRRSSFGMAYDSSRNRTIVFGGLGGSPNSNQALADTWEYDGTDWIEIIVPDTNPVKRYANMMTYNSTRKITVLFGGLTHNFDGVNFTEEESLNDLWEYNGISWVQVNVTPPSPRGGSAMTYMSASDKTLLFGGIKNVSLEIAGDTWEYATPQNPVLVQSAGDGYVFYDASNGSPTPVINDFLGPSVVNGTVRPTSVSPVFGYALEGPVIDPLTSSPLELEVDGNTVGIIKMRIEPFYGFIPLVAPSIINFTPSAGIVGSTVIINGSAFLGTTQVSFDGYGDGYGPIPAIYEVISNIQLKVTVPADAYTGNIVVTNAQGDFTSVAQFTVLPSIINVIAPFISEGSVVSIIGHSFRETISVEFNGVSATFYVLDDTEIQAIIPIGGTSGDLVVTTIFGSATFTDFSIVPPPTISNISPTSGAIGDFLSITGSGFQSPGISTVDVDFVRVTPTQILPATRTIFNDTQISAIIPDPLVAQASTNYNIRITTDGGIATSSQQFTLIPRPLFLTNDSFDPISGAAGQTVAIFAQFGLTGIQSVFFDGYQSQTVNFINDGYITAIIPDIPFLDDPNVAITVVSVGGTRSTIDTGPSTTPSTFTVLLDPTISSISPTSGASNSTVVITGTNFLTIDTVLFFGTSTTAIFTINNANQITTIVPLSSSGISTGPIKVKSGILEDTSSQTFTYIPPPNITSLNTSTGGYGTPATTVIISGTNLRNSNGTAPTVRFGGIIAAINSHSPTSVSVNVPSGAGNGLTLQTDGGTDSETFTVVPAPSVYYSTPTSGRCNFGGTNVTIVGNNFLGGSTNVYFAYDPLFIYHQMSITSLSATQIVVNTAELTSQVGNGRTFVIYVEVIYSGGTYVVSSPNTYFGFNQVG